MTNDIRHQFSLPGYWEFLLERSVEGRPQFPLPGWGIGGDRQVVHEFDGKRYYLCSLHWLQQYMLYRLEDPLIVEPTLFVPCGINLAALEPVAKKNDPYARSLPYPKALFAEQVRGGQSGRLMLYNHLPARNCLAALFFAQDGTGKFFDWDPFTFAAYYDPTNIQFLDFSWDGGRYGLPSRGDILTCAWQTLLPLCEDVFVKQIWPRMEKPYLVADYPDKLFRFLCGSQEELERVTRCICHADTTLFADTADTRSVRVTYQACTSKQPGKICDWTQAFRSIGNGTSRKMCLLALAYNTFEGETHKYNFSASIDDFTIHHEVKVDAAPPSLHERAEALLFLYDWLEGKVSDEERRQLLGLDAPEGVIR